jgi:hypothetical protein
VFPEDGKMHPEDLELFTTAELVEELMRRQTFLGLVLHSEQELRNDWRGARVFKLHFNDNLDADQARRLLQTVADHMDSHC